MIEPNTKKPQFMPKLMCEDMTPEMIEAGAEAVSRCLGAGELYPPMTEEEFATKIYLAMRAAEKALHESRISCFGRDYGL